jgi:SAM-dependent methyltransferase
MAELHHSDGRRAFGDDAAGYQSARPPYPDWIFAHLGELCGGRLGEVFEIGPGTGQATAPLLAMGARVTAVEPDARLAEHLRSFLANPQLQVVVDTFEAAALPQGAFDLGLAATSFHWLDQAAALAKVGRLLRPGGVWAAIANVFGDSTLPDAFHDATQGVLGPLPFSPATTGAVPYALDVDARLADLRAAGVFEEFVAERRNWTLVLDTKGVRALYGTYSHITTRPRDQRERVLDGLAEIAERQFGGRVERNVVTTLQGARRR